METDQKVTTFAKQSYRLILTSEGDGDYIKILWLP